MWTSLTLLVLQKSKETRAWGDGELTPPQHSPFHNCLKTDSVCLRSSTHTRVYHRQTQTAARITPDGASGKTKAKVTTISSRFSPQISLHLLTAAYSSLHIFSIGLPLLIQSTIKSPEASTKNSQDFYVHLSQKLLR